MVDVVDGGSVVVDCVTRFNMVVARRSDAAWAALRIDRAEEDNP